MPITRIPVVHKFGIISQSQRVDLEKRIAHKAFTEAKEKENSQNPVERSLPFEVTQEFVFKFNDSSDEERVVLTDLAFKMLEKLKRLADVKNGGKTEQSKVSRAWLDLALLAQCRSSSLEQSCLDVLLTSLNQAPFSEEHILSLFYVAKTGLHCLRKLMLENEDDVLRSGEVKMVEMTSVVFLRLFCHHIMGHLKVYDDQLSLLLRYLKGFSEKAQRYSSFPICSKAVQIILESARIICTLNKEEVPLQRTSSDVNQQPDGTDCSVVHGNIITDYFVKITAEDTEPSSFTFLWHCLNVWYAVYYDNCRLRHALHDLYQSTSDLEQESWLTLVVSFHVLTDASCQSIEVLEVFQYLFSRTLNHNETMCTSCFSSYSTTRDNQSFQQSPQSILPRHFKEECSIDESGDGSPNVLERLQAFADITLQEDWQQTNNNSSSGDDDTSVRCSLNKDYDVINRIPSEFIFDRATTHENGSYLTPDSTPVTTTTTQPTTVTPMTYQYKGQNHGMKNSQSSLYNWPSLLICMFCECLALVCINGGGSKVRKQALIGGTQQQETKHLTRNHGLVDFLNYDKDSDHDDYLVRSSAVHGLIQVYYFYQNDDGTKQGLSDVAWSALVECQRIEQDQRVLDAIKLGKIEAELQKSLKKEDVSLSLLSSKIANALAEISHTKYINISAYGVKKCFTTTQKNSAVQQEKRKKAMNISKPTLRQEINLHQSVKDSKLKRNSDSERNVQLRQVLNDQWRKELHETMVEETGQSEDNQTLKCQ